MYAAIPLPLPLPLGRGREVVSFKTPVFGMTKTIKEHITFVQNYRTIWLRDLLRSLSHHPSPAKKLGDEAYQSEPIVGFGCIFPILKTSVVWMRIHSCSAVTTGAENAGSRFSLTLFVGLLVLCWCTLVCGSRSSDSDPDTIVLDAKESGFFGAF